MTAWPPWIGPRQNISEEGVSIGWGKVKYNAYNDVYFGWSFEVISFFSACVEKLLDRFGSKKPMKRKTNLSHFITCLVLFVEIYGSCKPLRLH